MTSFKALSSVSLALALATLAAAGTGCNEKTVCRKLGEGRVNLAVLGGQLATSQTSNDYFMAFCSHPSERVEFLGQASKDLSKLMAKKLSYTTVECLEYKRVRTCDDVSGGIGFPYGRPFCRWEQVCIRDRKDFHKRTGYDEAESLRTLAVGTKSGALEACTLLMAGLPTEAVAKLASVSEAMKAGSVEENFDKLESTIGCER